VQDEAVTLLQALGSTRPGPVDEILYEEIEDFTVFSETFAVDAHTDAIANVLREQEDIRELHEELVPVQLSFEEFWRRFFFRLHQEDEHKRRVEERKAQERLEAEKRAQEQDDADTDLDLDLDRTLELQNMRDNDDNDTFNRPLDSAAETDELVTRDCEADRRAAVA
jgi:hypothetical protein